MAQGFNLTFKMFLEGIECPFTSANIMCTPNGVEASINIFANRFIYDLKPKTAVQIFFQDFIPDEYGIRGWRLMFDGFISSYYKVDQVNQGRMISLVCRDFRADIRKAPAALSYTGDMELSSMQLYTMEGIFQTVVVDGGDKSFSTRVYGGSLNPLSLMLRYIAGSASGAGTVAQQVAADNAKAAAAQKAQAAKDAKAAADAAAHAAANPAEGATFSSIPGVNAAGKTPVKEPIVVTSSTQKNGESHYTSNFGYIMKTDEAGRAKCGFFLDAIVRGFWNEAVGGTTVGMFINKRCRVDKRILIPQNRAGYNMWFRQSAGLQVGGYVLGGSRFSSLDAAVRRLAGLFYTRVYSCSTPTLIPIDEENPAVNYIMDVDVRRFINKQSPSFGGKFILNETMLLPPFEFTAPPNFNLFFPPMYDKVVWQYDVDSDFTRGYFDQVPSLGSTDGTDLKILGIQVPNALFNQTLQAGKDNAKDKFGRIKPPMTLEERYKGVSVSYGQVQNRLGCDDACVSMVIASYGKDGVKKVNDKAKEILAQLQKSRGESTPSDADITEAQGKALDAIHLEQQDAIQGRRVQYSGGPSIADTQYSMRRQALLKFLNSKYNGRVVTVDMQFNPYPVCGFPGMIIDDEEAGGTQSSKAILGMVQQVKHMIFISSESAEASTSILMNNAHFVDEPTDMDEDGNPLWMKPTVPEKSEANSDTLWFNDITHVVPEAIPQVSQKLDSKEYDLENVPTYHPGQMFAKDLLSLTYKQTYDSTKTVKGKQVKVDNPQKVNDLTYLDHEYTPQFIHRFYKEVMGQKKNGFMVDTFTSLTKQRFFIYDTIHEATAMLRKKHPELLYDYEAAMTYCSRNICSADAFYQVILGLSVKDSNGNFVCNETEFDDTIIHEAYYGVTTTLWNGHDIDGLKQNISYNVKDGFGNVVDTVTKKGLGLMAGPGAFSSINETMPHTAFIQERRVAAENYIKEATRPGQAMSFTINANGGVG